MPGPANPLMLSMFLLMLHPVRAFVVSFVVQVVGVTTNDTIADDDTVVFCATAAAVVSHFPFSLTSKTKSKFDIYLSPA